MFNALIQRLKRDQRGLTLIELLVVIVILGIIAAIAIPMVMGNSERANESTNLTNQKVLQDAVYRYLTINQTDTLPTGFELDDLTTADDGGPYLSGDIPDPVGCTGAAVFQLNGNTVQMSNNTCPGAE